VKEITEKINVGPDLDITQREAVFNLVKEFTDIFTLSLSEVFPVDYTTHKLKGNPDCTLPTKVHQKPITTAQKEWYEGIVVDMEKADIIQKVPWISSNA
ncbi:hypothetical protein JB92DRAFT_2777769, partial [Gautieria morchelliformis]